MLKHKEDAAVAHIDDINQRLVIIEHKLKTLIKMRPKQFSRRLFLTLFYINILHSESESATTRKRDKKERPLNDNKSKASTTTLTWDEIKNKIQKLENLRSAMNEEFRKCLAEMKALAKEFPELKNRNDRLEVEGQNMERLMMLKDVTLAEQDMRIQVR